MRRFIIQQQFELFYIYPLIHRIIYLNLIIQFIEIKPLFFYLHNLLNLHYSFLIIQNFE
jgi:hypothetical protein